MLATGGHNVGIVSEPGGAEAAATRCITRPYDGKYVDPDAYLGAGRAQKEGSWWPEWQAWLARRSGEPVAAAVDAAHRSGATPPLADAPGTYVLEK